MGDPEADKARAIQRAYEVIARVDESLASPRADGELWQGRSAPTATAPAFITKAINRPHPQPASMEAKAFTWGSVPALMKMIGSAVSDRIKVETRRTDDLEKRLAAIESLLARAKGTTQ